TAGYAVQAGQTQGDPSIEATALIMLGMVQVARGIRDGTSTFQRVWQLQGQGQIGLEWLCIRSADRSLWIGGGAEAKAVADLAWGLVSDMEYEAHPIEAARLQGSAALFLGGPDNLATADERLNEALARVRRFTLYQEELPILVALAELHRRRGKSGRARE